MGKENLASKTQKPCASKKQSPKAERMAVQKVKRYQTKNIGKHKALDTRGGQPGATQDIFLSLGQCLNRLRSRL